MHLKTSFAFLASALATVVAGSVLHERQNDVNGFLDALRSSKLNSLAQTLNDHQDVAQGLLSTPGPKLFLAPNDAAVAAYPTWTTNNKTLLEATIKYHILNGTFDPEKLEKLPLHTIGHTLLTDEQYVNLPGDNGQALALSQASGEPGQVNEAVNVDDFESDERKNFNDITIQPIKRGLTVPGTLTETLRFIGKHDEFVHRLSAAEGGLAEKLDKSKGLTVFAPSDDALAAFQQQQSNVSQDDLVKIINNHVVANRAVYSPLLGQQGSLISTGGQDIIFNGDDVSVKSGNTTAKITQTDIIHKGGVIHLIDTVFTNTNENKTRADEAAKSAADSARSDVVNVVTGKNAATSQGNAVPGPDENNKDGNNKNADDNADGDNGSGSAAGNANGAGNGNGNGDNNGDNNGSDSGNNDDSNKNDGGSDKKEDGNDSSGDSDAAATLRTPLAAIGISLLLVVSVAL